MSDKEPAPADSPVAAASGALELVKRAAQDGAADAREAASKTWAVTSRFVSRFVYTTCYTVSYGVVFPAALLAHAVPRNNAAVRGLIDGASAATRRVDEILAGSHQTSNAAPALSPRPA
jgi:hypothetical protein